MLELRKAIVEASIARGSDAWKQIAQQLANINGDSLARSSKQVAQRWDTLVRIYVSVEAECNDSGKFYGEVIDERQKRCKTEYRQLWRELIAQGNPGKRRNGKTATQPEEAPARSANGAIITQAPAPSLSPGYVRKFGEISKPFTVMLDTFDRSISPSEEKNEVSGLANKNIGTGSNWEPEDEEGLETMISVGGLKRQQDETEAEVARATQSMIDSMQSISKGASTSESFCLEVDQKDWSMVIKRLSAISQKYQATSEQGIREEVGADVHTNSATRSTHDHNNLAQRTLLFTSSLYTKFCKRAEESSSSGKRIGGSIASPATSTATFAGLPDIMLLSPKSDLESVSGLRWLEAGGARDIDKAKDGPAAPATPTTERRSLIPELRHVVGDLGLRTVSRPMIRRSQNRSTSPGFGKTQ